MVERVLDPVRYGLDPDEVLSASLQGDGSVQFVCYSKNLNGEHWRDGSGQWATHVVTHWRRP